MPFQAKTFVEEVNRLLASASKAFDTLLDAFLFASHNLKEVHRYSPDFRMGWLKSEIQRVFNVDVEKYARSAEKIGGGKMPDEMERGKAIIRQVGTYEAFRAESLLTRTEFLGLTRKLAATVGPEMFRAKVDALVADRPAERPAPVRVSSDVGHLQKENLKLRRENEELRRENSGLKAALGKLSETLKDVGV